MIRITLKPESKGAKPEVIELESNDGLEILNHGVKYHDPAMNLTFLKMYTDVARVEVDMQVTEAQEKYSVAFQKAYSDQNQRGSRLTTAT